MSRGLIVAVLGPDGAGKSTQCEELRRWLSPTHEVELMHLGRGDAVADARQRLADLKWAVLEATTERRRPVSTRPVDRRGAGAPSGASFKQRLVLLLRDLSRVSLARRKHRDLTRAEALRERGGVVITDRFPCGERELDGPGIRASADDPWLRHALMRLERREYRCMNVTPDVVFILELSTDVALARAPEHRREDIERKNAALANVRFLGARVERIDASRNISEVHRDLRAIVGSMLEGGGSLDPRRFTWEEETS